jgi:glucose/arabinose dehydrogenase
LSAPSSVDLAATSVQAGAVTRSLTVSNTGSATLNFGSLSFPGGDPAFSSPIAPSGGTLDPGENGDITFTVTPTTLGPLSATLSVASDDASSPASIALLIDVVADPAVAIANPAVLQPTQVSGGPVARSVPIANSGSSQTLHLTGISFGGTAGTQFTNPIYPATLAPGGGGTIDFTFTPGTPGLSTATMTILSDAEGAPSTLVSLELETVPNLTEGITFRVYQADRPLTEMPTLGNDQSPNIDEVRPTINYKDADKNGVTDAGADDNFGTIPPLDRLEHLYCEAIGVLDITTPGDYEFQLTADDGARLEVDGTLVIDNSTGVVGSPKVLTSGPITLASGFHNLLVKFWNGAGGPCLKLAWKTPGSGSWEVISAHDAGTSPNGFRTENYTRVVSPGSKAVYFPGQGQTSGELTGLHPGYTLFTIAGDFGAAGSDPSFNPADIIIDGTATPYRPQTGAIGFLPDGTLLQTNFTPSNPGSGPPTNDATANDRIYAVSGAGGNDLSAVTIREVARGLNAPMGVVAVGDDLYVAEVFKITRLRDNNDDGDYLDPGEEETIVPIVADNFHNWTFGLIHQDGWLYCTLSADIGGTDTIGINGYAPKPRGNWFRVCIDAAQAPVGTTEQLAGGLRTPNGLGIGPEGKMFGTDNQGSWNPDNSLYEMTPGHFYGHYNLWFQFGTFDPVANPNTVAATGLADPTRQPSSFWDSSMYWGPAETPIYASAYEGGTRRVTLPAVYLQQNSMCNSPTDPVLIEDPHPAFKGQMFVGEHRRGGIRRVFLEKINGRFQGCVMRFTQGLSCGPNSMRWGPDGALYLGGIGGGGNWKWRNTTFGLERLKFNGNEAFEIQTLRAVTDGFILTMTKPVAAGVLGNPGNYETFPTATYPNPSYIYGAGKVDSPALTVTNAVALPDGRSVRLTVPGIVAESTVHLRLKNTVVSSTGDPLWSGEAYYTMNSLPSAFESAWAEWITEHFPGSADLTLIAPSADPEGDGTNNLGEFFGGGDPDAVDGGHDIGASGNSGTLTLESREPVTIPSPLEVRWESSGNLTDWTDVTEDVQYVGEAAADTGFVTRSYAYTAADNPEALFIRRVVEQP